MNYAEMLDDPWKGIIIDKDWCLVPKNHIVLKIIVAQWAAWGIDTKAEHTHFIKPIKFDHVKMPKSAIEKAIVQFNNSVTGF